jgi:hypothetical protein
MLPIFRGAATALLTPFRPDGSIDLPAWDRLLEREQMVLVPTDRADFAAFLAGLRTYAPKTLDFSKEADYIPESCDHNGHHHG